MLLLVIFVVVSSSPIAAQSFHSLLQGRNLLLSSTAIANDSNPIKHTDNTVRVDPFDKLTKYRGGYNLTNEHYWSVSHTLAKYITLFLLLVLISACSLQYSVESMDTPLVCFGFFWDWHSVPTLASLDVGRRNTRRRRRAVQLVTSSTVTYGLLSWLPSSLS